MVWSSTWWSVTSVVVLDDVGAVVGGLVVDRGRPARRRAAPVATSRRGRRWRVTSSRERGDAEPQPGGGQGGHEPTSVLSAPRPDPDTRRGPVALSAGGPGSCRWCGRRCVRRCSAAPSRADTPRPGARATWRSPVWLPPRSVSSGHRGDDRLGQPVTASSGSSPAVRAGSRPARHSVSSTSRFPRPAIRRWSSRRAFSAVREPSSAPASSAAVTEAASGPSRPCPGRAPGRPGDGDPRMRTSVPSVEGEDEAVPSPDRRRVPPYSSRAMSAPPSTSSRPVIPKRRPMVGPSVPSSSSLPIRSVALDGQAAELGAPPRPGRRGGARAGRAPARR